MTNAKLFTLLLIFQLASYASPITAAETSPSTVVRALYKQIVTRGPLGIPKGEDKAAIWPFLSKRFARRLDAAQACENDYFRQHSGGDGKPEFGWLESGLFSGENEQATPGAAVVEHADTQKDGSFHVHVRLTYRDLPDTHAEALGGMTARYWQVVAVVIPENGRFVVDDILFFKKDSTRVEARQADLFSGCNGSRWVGSGTAARSDYSKP